LITVARVALPLEETRCRLEDFDGLFQFGVAASQSPDLGGGHIRDPVTLAVIDLMLAYPVALSRGCLGEN
jgi:hypothetical protein